MASRAGSPHHRAPALELARPAHALLHERRQRGPGPASGGGSRGRRRRSRPRGAARELVERGLGLPVRRARGDRLAVREADRGGRRRSPSRQVQRPSAFPPPAGVAGPEAVRVELAGRRPPRPARAAPGDPRARGRRAAGLLSAKRFSPPRGARALPARACRPARRREPAGRDLAAMAPAEHPGGQPLPDGTHAASRPRRPGDRASRARPGARCCFLRVPRGRVLRRERASPGRSCWARAEATRSREAMASRAASSTSSRSSSASRRRGGTRACSPPEDGAPGRVGERFFARKAGLPGGGSAPPRRSSVHGLARGPGTSRRR